MPSVTQPELSTEQYKLPEVTESSPAAEPLPDDESLPDAEGEGDGEGEGEGEGEGDGDGDGNGEGEGEGEAGGGGEGEGGGVCDVAQADGVQNMPLQHE